MFKLIISNGETILKNINLVVFKTSYEGKQLTSGSACVLKTSSAQAP